MFQTYIFTELLKQLKLPVLIHIDLMVAKMNFSMASISLRLNKCQGKCVYFNCLEKPGTQLDCTAAFLDFLSNVYRSKLSPYKIKQYNERRYSLIKCWNNIWAYFNTICICKVLLSSLHKLHEVQFVIWHTNVLLLEVWHEES